MIDLKYSIVVNSSSTAHSSNAKTLVHLILKFNFITLINSGSSIEK